MAEWGTSVMLEEILAEFGDKVKITDDCWPWLGSVNPAGYGTIKRRPWRGGPHCLAYTLLYGPIPSGKEIDHTCRTRACINPAHLIARTHRDNCKRGAKKFYSKRAYGPLKRERRIYA